MLRVAVFGSFYRGFNILNELINGLHKDNITLVGVASDDPSQSFTSSGKRVWQYPHTREEELMVPELAQSVGIEPYFGRVKCPVFTEQFREEWKPDICFMGTFGQLIREPLFSYPKLGFFNYHPCGDYIWPSNYAGGNPFQIMLDNKDAKCNIAMHCVDEEIDHGLLVRRSSDIIIPANSSVVDLHKLTSPTVAEMVRAHLGVLLQEEDKKEDFIGDLDDL